FSAFGRDPRLGSRRTPRRRRISVKRLVLPLIAAVAVAAVVIPSLAGAAGTKKTKCHYDQKAVVVTTKVLSGSPPATGANVYAGTLDGSFCGKTMHGAVRG